MRMISCLCGSMESSGSLKRLWREILRFLLSQRRKNAGYKTYERSAIFLMLKAFYEVIPREKIKKIQIDFALGNGIYGELVGDIPVDEKLLTSVKVHMEKLRDAAIPVKKAECQYR